MSVSDETILKLSDTLDEASMIYYDASINDQFENTAVTNYNVEKGRLNFYECLLKVSRIFLGETIDLYDEEACNKINKLFDDLNEYLKSHQINSEEIRRALLLLDIKGFKNVNFPLDYITPDTIGIIVTYLVSYLAKIKKVNLLDVNFGVGNLAFTIYNHSDKEINLTGIENHELLARVAAMKANLMQIKLNLYHEDALAYLPLDTNLVVSDLAAYEYKNDNYHSSLFDEGINYFPYLAIEHFLNMDGDVNYIYIIDNNFFSQKGNVEFKKMLENKGSIKALISLPLDLFQNKEDAKSILILNNHPEPYLNTEVFILPSINKRSEFLSVLDKIKKIL